MLAKKISKFSPAIFEVREFSLWFVKLFGQVCFAAFKTHELWGQERQDILVHRRRKISCRSSLRTRQTLSEKWMKGPRWIVHRSWPCLGNRSCLPFDVDADQISSTETRYTSKKQERCTTQTRANSRHAVLHCTFPALNSRETPKYLRVSFSGSVASTHGSMVWSNGHRSAWCNDWCQHEGHVHGALHNFFREKIAFSSEINCKIQLLGLTTLFPNGQVYHTLGHYSVENSNQ